MRIHVVRHVPYEGLGCLRAPILADGHSISESGAWEADPFPPPERFDALVLLGGPMGVCDATPAPWMADERRFLGVAIDAGRAVLGICLGGQLVATVLGAEVRRHRHPEIGWHEVCPTDAGRDGPLSPFFEPGVRVMQWHFDTFDLPDGAVRLCGSRACDNQAFAWGDRVLALQFHPEMTRQEVATVLERDGAAPAGEFVQTAEQMLEREPFERLAVASDRFIRGLLRGWESPR
jgi:GMP synthase-like glutamine amidotransferase